MEISGTREEEGRAPGICQSGAAGTGQETVRRSRPGRPRRSVEFPVLHYSDVRVRTWSTKREYRTGRALACRRERG